jgi:hypothetical protein
MYNVRKKYVKLISAFDKGVDFLKEKNLSANPKEEYLFRSGIINYIWQSWNQFWRAYWLAEIIGGIDIHNKKVNPYNPSLTENQAVYFLLKGTVGGAYNPSLEKSWGDYSIISNVARNMFKQDGKSIPTLSISIKALKISSVISLLGDSIKHIQAVRNYSVHMNEFNVKRLLKLKIYYHIPNFKYPTDFVFAVNKTDGKHAIMSWKDELFSFLSLID